MKLQNQCIHIKTNQEITLDILLFVIIFRLKIENTVPQDSGYYMCKASNRGGEKNSTAYLHIKNGKKTKKKCLNQNYLNFLYIKIENI